MTRDPAPSSCPNQVPLTMLCFDVYAANLSFGRVYKPHLDPLGLTYPQYLVLLTLWKEDGQTVGQIGRSLGLESSTLTPLLKRLEAAGLVNRKRDSEDERRVRISLTAHAHSLQGQAMNIPGCVAEATGLSIAEITGLQRLLHRLRESLDASHTSPPHP